MSRLFLVTPARDEIQNLPRLEAALKAQTVAVDGWVVLENGSSDGTVELVDALQAGGAVQSLLAVHEKTERYAVGTQYAGLIARGLALVREKHGLKDGDFFGILDADVVPAPDYYEKLLVAMVVNPKLGITSGVTTDNSGKASVHRKGWVRGSCRLWRVDCLNETGYPVAPSADTLSAIKAEMKGWTVAVTEDAVAEAREVGARINHRYYGQSAYYRGETLLHCALRTLKYLAAGKPRTALAFFLGYWHDWHTHAPQIEDAEVKAWCRNALPRLALRSCHNLLCGEKKH